MGNADVRLADALATMERVAQGRVRVFGAAHPDTLTSWASLASLYGRAQRHDEVPALRERIVTGWKEIAAERERRLGPIHPEAVDARERHAYCHRWIDRTQDEVSLVEQIASDHERLLGPTHPRTLRAQTRLVFRYYEGRYDTARAGALGERIIGDVYAVLGADHHDLRVLRAAVILAYAANGRIDDHGPHRPLPAARRPSARMIRRW